MKKERPELRKEAQPPSPQTDTGNLTETVKWVYQRYGTDLSAFFEDAIKDVARKHPETPANDSFEACQS